MTTINNSQTQNVLFIGHGSPMNAIESNSFTKTLEAYGAKIPQPRAILMISAHWMTKGTWLTHMSQPQTIHDFYGFPQELFAVQYPAPGEPQLAELISQKIAAPIIGLDEGEWGLDHGAWSVLKHLYPTHNIPVVQLSLDMTKPAAYHFELGKKLRFLKDQNILIVGSGNIVHNLRRISWDPNEAPPQWALDFDQCVKESLSSGNYNDLVDKYNATDFGKLSVPTPDHYFPFLYILGLIENPQSAHFIFEGFQNGSISMRSLAGN